MVKAMIVYASLTGNTEEGAEILEEAFEEAGVDVEVVEASFADPEDFLDYDIVVVGTYTYGPDGNLPEEIVDFYEELEEVDLSGKVFGTFGSGDDFYEKYCKSVDDFDQKLTQAGASQGFQPVKYNLIPGQEAIDDLNTMAQALIDQAKS